MPKLIEDPIRLILQQARNILYSEGYPELNMRKVAKLSGVSVGTVYNYFPTKKDLVTCLMMEYWDRYYQVLETIDQEEADFYAKIRRAFEELTVFVDTFQEIWLKSSGYIQDIKEDRKGEKEFIDKVILRLEKMILHEKDFRETLKIKNLDSHDIAQFIFMHMMMLAQVKQTDYCRFEKILKALLA
jgi:AcrR family transcriptional regulator